MAHKLLPGYFIVVNMHSKYVDLNYDIAYLLDWFVWYWILSARQIRLPWVTPKLALWQLLIFSDIAFRPVFVYGIVYVVLSLFVWFRHSYTYHWNRIYFVNTCSFVMRLSLEALYHFIFCGYGSNMRCSTGGCHVYGLKCPNQLMYAMSMACCFLTYSSARDVFVLIFF